MSISNSSPKKDIPLAVPLVMAAGSVFSSIFGGSQSAEAAEEQRRQMAAERARVEAERLRKNNETWLSTASGQNTMRMLRDEASRAFKRVSGASAVGGSTDAAVAMEKEQQNMKQAEIIAQANANYEDKKDQADARYRQELSALKQQEIAATAQKKQAIAQAAGGVSSALMQGALTTFGGTKLGQSLMGTPNISKSIPQYHQNYKQILNPYLHSLYKTSGWA